MAVRNRPWPMRGVREEVAGKVGAHRRDAAPDDFRLVYTASTN